MITKRSLGLFNHAAANVPAYADFLKERKIEPGSIKTTRDFKHVPITSKKNYLQQYPMPELLWRGDLGRPLIFCSTSGSTGMPYYFARDEKLSWQYSWLVEDFLKHGQGTKQKQVLVILAFGMGVWIGGIITLRAFEIALKRMDYPASILPTGYNKAEVIKALERLSPQFGQTIIIGYPPFVKEIVDEAVRRQIDLKKLKTRLIFAAESFSENFRDYLCKKTGANPLFDTLNIYGTADIGAMAYETPMSIFIRRQSVDNPTLFKNIFGQIGKTPTLAQYNPRFVEFEAVDGEVVLSGNSAVPLIRYAIGDHGGVMGYKAMSRAFRKSGLSLEKELSRAGLGSESKTKPFVFVYERSNFAVSLVGMIIYPEYIKETLLAPELSPYFTGKFTMITRFDKQHNQYLEVNVELQDEVKTSPRLRALAKKAIRQSLNEKSSEFAEVSKTQDTRKLLKLVFWPQNHPRYFATGVKQKWVVQDS